MIRTSLSAVMAAVIVAGAAIAQPQIMSAPDASSAVARSEMILVDIRSPAEWAETGVAEGAVALTMHSAEFPKQITSLLSAGSGKSIGLICATGGRTEYVVSILAKNGFENVIDVSEGMLGNSNGPGWIARGMPLISAEEAQAGYQSLTLSQ